MGSRTVSIRMAALTTTDGGVSGSGLDSFFMVYIFYFHRIATPDLSV